MRSACVCVFLCCDRKRMATFCFFFRSPVSCRAVAVKRRVFGWSYLLPEINVFFHHLKKALTYRCSQLTLLFYLCASLSHSEHWVNRKDLSVQLELLHIYFVDFVSTGTKVIYYYVAAVAYSCTRAHISFNCLIDLVFCSPKVWTNLHRENQQHQQQVKGTHWLWCREFTQDSGLLMKQQFVINLCSRFFPCNLWCCTSIVGSAFTMCMPLTNDASKLLINNWSRIVDQRWNQLAMDYFSYVFLFFFLFFFPVLSLCPSPSVRPFVVVELEWMTLISWCKPMPLLNG